MTYKKESTWPESASKLYRPSDRHLSAKLVPTFADKGARGQRDGSLSPYSRLSRPEPLLFLPRPARKFRNFTAISEPSL
jgi:hypothetical protein